MLWNVTAMGGILAWGRVNVFIAAKLNHTYKHEYVCVCVGHVQQLHECVCVC